MALCHTQFCVYRDATCIDCPLSGLESLTAAALAPLSRGLWVELIPITKEQYEWLGAWSQGWHREACFYPPAGSRCAHSILTSTHTQVLRPSLAPDPSLVSRPQCSVCPPWTPNGGFSISKLTGSLGLTDTTSSASENCGHTRNDPTSSSSLTLT